MTDEPEYFIPRLGVSRERAHELTEWAQRWHTREHLLMVLGPGMKVRKARWWQRLRVRLRRWSTQRDK